MSNHYDSFVALIDAAKLGESSAIDQLISQFSGEMKNYVVGSQALRSSELSVRDICQMTWIRVLRYLPKFNGCSENDVCVAKFRAWLKTTANSVLSNEVDRINAVKRGRSKQARAAEPGILPSKERTPSSIVADEEYFEKIRAYMESLENPVQIECLRLRFYDGLKIGEIADKLDLTIEQVRYQISKALKSFKNSILPPTDQT